MGAEIHSLQDVYSKLHDTVIIFKGEAYRVAVNPGDVWNHHVALRKLGTRDPMVIVDYRDKDFNYSRYELGYINSGGGATYVKRIPLRQYRSGLCIRTLTPGLSTETFFGKPMREMLLGRYPSYENALAAVKKGKTSMAFDRMYAVARFVDYSRSDDSEIVSYVIHYKNENIASIMDDGSYLFRMGMKHQLHVDNLSKHGLNHANGAKV